MRITNFESTGLDKIDVWIRSNNIENIDIVTLKGALRTTNISFVAENIDRVQSTLLCELKDSYVQQSQRYVTMDDTSYDLPANLSTKDYERAEFLIKKSYGIYNKMGELCEGDFKGRPKIENYKYGIPIEDARYILPLCVTTNLSVAMSGDKLYDLYCLFTNLKYSRMFSEMKGAVSRLLPKSLVRLLPSTNEGSSNQLLNALYSEEMEKLSSSNMVLLSSFKDLDLKVGLGALTSTLKETPSEKVEKWGEKAPFEAKALAERVLNYGHDSIAEQARTTFGMMCSLVTYHQQIRHRLSENYREDLLDIILDKERVVIIPPSILNSKFHLEFMGLVNEFKDFRIYVYEEYGEDTALLFLLNCDAIKLITSTNARIDHAMLSERICQNSQWEIRELSMKKLSLLKKMSDVLYEKTLPSCVSGKCREGKLTCGKQMQIKKEFNKL